MSRSLLAVLLLAGCPLPDDAKDTGGACTEIATASVTVNTVDADGAPLVPDAVGWSVDGGESQDAECVADPCTQWVAGWEVAGEIVVTAVLSEAGVPEPGCVMWRAGEVTTPVEMDEDGCHVVGQTLTLALDQTSTECPDTGR